MEAGAGISATDADVEVDGSKISADLGSGIGFVFGAGYDFRVSRRISVTPAFGFSYGRPGDLKLAGETLFTDFSQNVAQALPLRPISKGARAGAGASASICPSNSRSST